MIVLEPTGDLPGYMLHVIWAFGQEGGNDICIEQR